MQGLRRAMSSAITAVTAVNGEIIMVLSARAIACSVVALSVSSWYFAAGPALAADLDAGDNLVEHHAGSAWVVTLGGWAVVRPDYEGSDDYEVGFKPIINVRRSGSREWLALPDDKGGFALYETHNFRIGPAFGFVWERDSGDNRALRGLDDVDFTFEAGVFAEYWPTENLRTRFEVLQGLGGHEGLVANFSADAVWRPSERWLFTVGPRLTVVSDEYADSYFSIGVGESAIGLPAYDAEGGLHSAGVGASATYRWTPQVALKLYAEYDRLLGDAADSPIVDDLGSEDQFTVGVGASYRFEIRR